MCGDRTAVAFDFFFKKASGNEPGTDADAGATCPVLVDEDTGYMKVVPALAKTAVDDHANCIKYLINSDNMCWCTCGVAW